MFKLEDLLSLFPNKKIREMLVYSYNLSQEKDKDLSNSVFEQLLSLKGQNPSINIILDATKNKSYFSPSENTIYINSLSIETFFHELTHLLSYNYYLFQIPDEYYSFKRDFLSNPNNTSLILQFLDLCKRKKEEILKKISNKSIDINNNYTLSEMNNVEEEVIQFDSICKIEDIIDSIYDGQSFSHGVTNVKDDNNIAIKAQETAGHGCEYFSNRDYQFEEILADYQAIKLTDPNNELFTLLKNILGTEFINFLDQRCNEICGKISLSKIEINNNIQRK